MTIPMTPDQIRQITVMSKSCGRRFKDLNDLLTIKVMACPHQPIQGLLYLIPRHRDLPCHHDPGVSRTLRVVANQQLLIELFTGPQPGIIVFKLAWYAAIPGFTGPGRSPE